MKHVTLFVCGTFLLFSSIAFAQIDFQCQSECIGKGYTFQTCQNQCDFGSSQDEMARHNEMDQQRQNNQSQYQETLLACQKGNQYACGQLRYMPH